MGAGSSCAFGFSSLVPARGQIILLRYFRELSLAVRVLVRFAEGREACTFGAEQVAALTGWSSAFDALIERS
jgi:hypothetical protein